MTWRTRSLSAVAVVLSWAIPAVCGAQSFLHQLRVTDADSAWGDVVDVQVLYDNTSADDVRGWSFSVAPQYGQLNLLDLLRGDGFVGLAADVDELVEIGDGWRADVLLAFSGSVSLPPAVDIELYRATYLNEVVCPNGALLQFIDGPVGAPGPSEIRLFDGTVVEPTVSSGRVTATGIPSPTDFTYVASPVAMGAGSTATVSFLIADVVEQDSQGFSMSVTHDASSFNVIDIDASGPVAALSGGAGPVFFGTSIESNGWTGGVIYFFIGGPPIAYSMAGDPAVDVTYQSTGGAGDGTELRFESIGSPPVSNVVVVAGASIPVCAESGVITVLDGESFRRGDINSDGSIDIADAVSALSALFIAGAVIPDCLDAGDSNDDGSFDLGDPVTLLTSLFSTPAPGLPAPWPDCGFDLTADALTCDVPTLGCP